VNWPIEIATRNFHTSFLYFFGLLALPLGIRSHRSVKSKGFTVGFIVVSLYYLLRIGGEALVETGYLPPEIGVWMPNFLFAFAGIILLYTANKEISIIPDINFIRKNRYRNNRGF